MRYLYFTSVSTLQSVGNQRNVTPSPLSRYCAFYVFTDFFHSNLLKNMEMLMEILLFRHVFIAKKANSLKKTC